ncbi:hypothetical protein MA5S0422_0557 [Mycobacteroides abscessus 5S-0422]|uniref:Uncharacterized protein n=1 Tax=Mycobacteroides abscessus subsp. bolletii 1513 TaxID=1299321 RepID=X8E336_9MYCO|nr:hypothetical protein MA5S0421_5387 [Mycobacteroides abscessus 5S-0421]EIU09928.1 hypothetical protein MA5S0304_5151 [Mycobacteroides abscessus 5S-0304]EIU19454.1 hypothetical protein MA5S0422_0557 [Mycobacteroides abscessus 5S-0422]EIU24300.1 hypothetical protein MA5S0817_4704 [Mycobacteroides abscessus 5S-0817]EIU34309.1 hypothetical protein MA5S0708_0466 [Mycobacteroides abscessus 5S-0708]EIU35479.1 hypothetical protein MA5S1212_0139 [Mycobacteroides abscessus 5S-1212]EIU44388.1 hypothet
MPENVIATVVHNHSGLTKDPMDLLTALLADIPDELSDR